MLQFCIDIIESLSSGSDFYYSSKNYMQRYQLSLTALYDKLTSSPDGFTTDQAQAKLQEVGPNHIQTMTGTSALTKFLGQFKDWMIILLIVSA